MTFPFGFSPNMGGAGDGGSDGSGAANPFAGGQFFNELQRLLSWQGGPVNWDLAKQIAAATVNAGESPRPSIGESSQVDDALRLADVWLNGVTDLPSGIVRTSAWSRQEWLDGTIEAWGRLCDPVARRMVAALSTLLPSEALENTGPLSGVVEQFGGIVFGAQVGHGLAGMAGEVLGSTDIGLPLAAPGLAVLLPSNVAAFGEGLERPDEEIRLYLALREAAHHRLFGHVSWLSQLVLDAVDSYARGIHFDGEALQAAMSEIDPMDPSNMQQLMEGNLFTPEDTPEQEAALRRLETLLALVEGWVDTVVSAAAAEHMPGAAALREATRRRRASGGPAEQTFATLVGLDLRPRRLRDAAALWEAVSAQHGVSARDEIWAHPDLLPDANDLDNPQGFAERVGIDPMAGFTMPEDSES
jgi:putative hydrolase